MNLTSIDVDAVLQAAPTFLSAELCEGAGNLLALFTLPHKVCLPR